MTIDAANLINLLGFITGGALYVMLLFMVLGGRVSFSVRNNAGEDIFPDDRLPLITALLGLCWNVSGMLVNGLPSLAQGALSHTSLSLLGAAAFTSLGYLPAVVVHSVLRTTDSLRQRKGPLSIVLIAYALSTVACVMHFHSAVVYGAAPSHFALRLLTYGFVALIVVLLITTRGQTNWRAGWIVALAGFAVSAVHLGHHDGKNYAWWLELVGHHASIALILAILYQDYRFAFADIFLKRAFALLILVALVVASYVMVASPFLSPRGIRDDNDPRAIGLLLTLWVGTALLYPWLRRQVDWFVDTIVLRRTDYGRLRVEVVSAINKQDEAVGVLDAICKLLGPALTALDVRWVSSETAETIGQSSGGSKHLFSLTNQFDDTGQVVLIKGARYLPLKKSGSQPIDKVRRSRSSDQSTSVFIPTAEAPQYFLFVAGLQGGRRLLSDDIAMLESLALLAARRIDALRVNHERCEMTMREQEIGKLVTEAKLRALRAQLNPHFLFNALTTISYLIQTSPKRAQSTLMRLTGLLRGVLRRSAGDFTTLGEEIDLIEDYLEIEQARFEERLEVKIEVPSSLRDLRVPSLILQPLVENAVKHGITPTKSGGTVLVTARLLRMSRDTPVAEINSMDREADSILKIAVHDTGAGVTERELLLRRKQGVGLSNIERRLECHYGETASLLVSSVVGSGTISEISLPIARAVEQSFKDLRTSSPDLMANQTSSVTKETRII